MDQLPKLDSTEQTDVLRIATRLADQFELWMNQIENNTSTGIEALNLLILRIFPEIENTVHRLIADWPNIATNPTNRQELYRLASSFERIKYEVIEA